MFEFYAHFFRVFKFNNFDLIQKNKPKNSKSKVNLTLFFAPVGLALMKIYREVFSYPHSLFYPILWHNVGLFGGFYAQAFCSRIRWEHHWLGLQW